MATEAQQLSTVPQRVSMQSVREPISRRQYVRVQVPLTVIIGGTEYTAADWSIGGFQLTAPALAVHGEDALSATLRLDVAGLHVHVTVACEVVWKEQAAGALGVRYRDLKSDQSEFLRQVVRSYLSGEIATSQHVLERLHGGQDVTVKHDAAVESRRPWRVGLRMVRYGFFGFLGICLLGVSGLAVYGHLFTVDA